MRRRCDSTFASLHIRRCVTSDFDISRVEAANGDVAADGQVEGHPEPERRFPHARPRGHDDQVPLLESGRDPVEVPEAGRDARDVRARLVELRDPLEALLEERLDVAELRDRLLLGEVEEDLLGAVDELRRLPRALPAKPCDLAAGPDQAPQRGGLLDDLRVVARVRARRHERRQLVDADLATGVLELAPLVELVDERDRVDGLALRVQRERGPVDLRVALPVELAAVRGEHLADGRDRTRGEHHRAEDRLLGVEVLRWDLRFPHRCLCAVCRHRTRL